MINKILVQNKHFKNSSYEQHLKGCSYNCFLHQYT